MTIASQTSRISYTGDGATTAFAVPFYFAANSDLVVVLQDTLGNKITQTLGTNYNLTGATLPAGGTCTFTVAPTTGYLVTIYRDPPLTQTTSYNNNDPFPAKSHENALDKLTAISQRTRDIMTRAVQLPDSDPVLDMHMPTIVNRKNKLLGFDGNGLPVGVIGPSFVGGTDVGVANVSTRAVAAVTTFAVSVLYLTTGGLATVGDGGAATYKRGTGAGSFTDGGGVSWVRIVNTQVFTFRALGAIGDGITDDTAAIQAALTANPSNVILDGEGLTYNITSAVTIPASSVFLKIRNANFTITGDINFLSVASGTATFFEMDTAKITAAGQTTTGRKCIDYSRMSNFTFRKVWINATANKSICWYGAGTGGVSPYYGRWDSCYAGNFNFGIMCDDAAGLALGVNSNTIYSCRLQPSAGNFGIYIGAFSQNINVLNCDLESVGGTGVYLDGTGHVVQGTRFESQTTGISVIGTCTNSLIGMNYYSSNTTALSFAGSSRKVNTVLYDPTNNGNFSSQGGVFSTHNNAGIGYATGAGGTVTQATSKATGVTLNTPCGAITLNGASLASGATVSFTHTCSAAVNGTEIQVINIIGGSAGSYVVNSANIGGAFTISVRNINVGALAEVIVLQYAIIKVVNA